MEQNSITIPIAEQDAGKMRKIFLVLGIIGLLYIILSSFLLDEIGFHNYLLWLFFLPSCVEAILYGLGKKRLFTTNSPVLKIDQQQIEKSSGGIFVTPHIYKWDTIKNIDIKLFEVLLTTNEGEQHTISLHSLTDENLKAVKDFLVEIKKARNF